MSDKISGVVIDVKRSSTEGKLLTVLTSDQGCVDIYVKSGYKISGKNHSLAQLFTLGEFELSNSGKFNVLSGGQITKSYFDLSKDSDSFALALYICDVVKTLAVCIDYNTDILRLILNSFHSLINLPYPPEMVKFAFEIRILALNGFIPNVACCGLCGSEDDLSFFADSEASVVCVNCKKEAGNELYGILPINQNVIKAIEYVMNCDLKRIYKFELSKADLVCACKISQAFMCNILQRKPKTLELFDYLTE